MEGLRMLMRLRNIYVWEVAEIIGVSEMTMYRWLRKYNKNHYEKILEAINKLSGVTMMNKTKKDTSMYMLNRY